MAKIYVVDDDPSARKSLSWLLETSSYSAEVFESAEEFLAAYHPEMSGCMLLDMRMHGLGGLQLQQRLKAIGSQLPIIFISGHVDVPTASEAFRAGACDVLTKPIDDSTLISRVEEAIAKHQRARQQEQQDAAKQQQISTLTPRERDAFDQLLKGVSIKQLAIHLGIGIQTAAKHRSRVLHKLGCSTDVELVESYRDFAKRAG